MTFEYWLALGIVLVILEIFVTSTVLLWLGVAALLVGLLLWVDPALSWAVQGLIFSIGAVLSIISGWRVYRARSQASPLEGALNRRAEQCVGEVVNLLEPIINGHGKVKVAGVEWKVIGVDAPVNTRVKVVGVDGVVLRVEKL